MSFGHFSILCPYAGRRTNGVHGVNSVRRRPFVNSWLTFGGLGLEASDRQRFARIQIVWKGQGTVQICLNRLFTTNSREVQLKISIPPFRNTISLFFRAIC
jgi:hypothetical protein